MHLVVGTAGHIDHGKSALVTALTGKDPDRLAEEKRRGITIDLGFADLDLGDGRILSIVDVPGHERFVRHMVAGATGIDVVLMVVAADQAVQPQTREHLAICSLLGITRGLVAITKSDLVDAELAEVAELELRELLEDTFLASAPIVHCSAKTGAGLEQLKQQLRELFEHAETRGDRGVARLPIDRSFVLKGFGTVVTGTLVSGSFAEGDEVEVFPHRHRGRIRGMQVHSQPTPTVVAGQRVAVNLQGLDCEHAPRGATLARPDTLVTTRRAWAELSWLADAPDSLKRGGPARFHQGTCERGVRVRPLVEIDDATTLAELFLQEDTVLAPGDRFILRRSAPVDTVGGGRIVDARPPLNKRARSAALESLETLGSRGFLAGGADDGLLPRLIRAGASGVEPSELGREMALASEQLEALAQPLRDAADLIQCGPRWFSGSVWRDIASRTLERLDQFHEREPLRLGVPREELRGTEGRDLPQDAWRTLLEELVRAGEIRLDGDRVSRKTHQVKLSAGQQQLAQRIEQRYVAAGLEPPELGELVEDGELEAARKITELLVAQGTLSRIQNGRLFHGAALESLREKLRDYAKTSATIDVATFKKLAGVTRKNAIPLLEHLDAERTTRRKGNLREIL